MSLYDALKVLTETPHIVSYLEVNDPQALAQARAALAVTDWEDSPLVRQAQARLTTDEASALYMSWWARHVRKNGSETQMSADDEAAARESAAWFRQGGRYDVVEVAYGGVVDGDTGEWMDPSWSVIAKRFVVD